MLLSVENLDFSYPATHSKALSSISLSVAENEYVAVLGANGSGKSTLARCIVGLLKQDSGSIHLDTDIGNDSGRVPSALVFQSPADQIIAETVELDIAFGPENIALPRDLMRERVSASLGEFALEDLAKASTQSLSSGHKQHLALAGVYVLNPALLVLDEPTSMLSPLARDSLLSFLDRFHGNGGAIIHITHDLSEASRADRVIVLDDGHMVFDDKPAKLIELSIETLEQWGLYGSPPPLNQKTHGETVLACHNLFFGPLRDFSLEIGAGTITAITGESGSGKTVLLELLAGLRHPVSGNLEHAEGVVVSLAVQESETSLFAEFVADDVAFGPRNQGLTGASLVERVSTAMNLAGLPFDQFADRKTFSLSGGERRKAALAGIIALETPIVLLDEPSSALDTRSRSQLLHLIIALKEAGRTVVFTTNRTEECAIADVVIALPLPPAGFVPETEEFPGKQAREDKKDRTRDQIALERLRKGAAGSYRPLDTAVHRLAPLTKYVLSVSSIAAAISVRTWTMLVLVILLDCIPVYFSRYSFKRLFFGILRILPWLVILAVFQYLITKNLLHSGIFLLRFVALYIPLSLFLFVTSRTEIMYGMEDVLRPLARVGVPVRDCALVTGIVFRFVALLYEEAMRITTARIIRGAGTVRKKGLRAAVIAMASLFVPLVLRTLTRAERLSQAITARYYGTGNNSRYLDWQIKGAQRILNIAVPLLAGLLIYLSAFL